MTNLKDIFKTIESESEVREYKLEHKTTKEGYTEFIITPKTED